MKEQIQTQIEQIPNEDFRQVVIDQQEKERARQSEQIVEQHLQDEQDAVTGKLSSRLGNAALGAIDTLMVEQGLEGGLPTPALDMRGLRDLVVGYVIYRFGKGAVVRGKAAITGRGDPGAALADTFYRRGARKEMTEMKKRHLGTDVWLRDGHDLRERETPAR